MIVDSPGIGESYKVSRQLEHYMSRAFIFIYVINISNAGGIEKDVESTSAHQWSSYCFCFSSSAFSAFLPLLSFFLHDIPPTS